ncbi:MAG: Universal stress protein family protein, partial [Actinomycetia bacterium]|nr:Universal stress protein family protein [Actinomycetes bacterium]
MAGEIVLGYDGQEGSSAALRTAVSMAVAFGRPLIIVFGYQPAQIGGDVGETARAVRAVGERVTADAVAAATEIDPAVDVRVELVDDRPAEALLRAG